MMDFSELPPLERIKRYRQLADDALKEAAATEASLKETYVLMAKESERMACILEQSLKHKR